MYNEFFGLQQSPFNLTPDPEFLYLTEQHREALAGLSYAIFARKGFVLLTGNAGTGKTTIVKRILEFLGAKGVQSSVIVHPTLTPSEFLEATLLDFGFKDIPSSKAQRVSILRNFLWKGHREGRVTALIVDEAHRLSLDVLEEIRLLGNFESASEKLLQIVLVGQTELDDLLNGENLRQFKQRIAQRFAIESLSALETERYIRYRWTKAGGSSGVFSADAIASIGQAAGGIPRVINVICDNALMQAFGEGSASVELRHVLSVCRELQFTVSVPKSTPVAEVPAPVREPVQAMEFFPLRTLARYETVAKKPSRLAGLLGRLGLRFKRRIETA